MNRRTKAYVYGISIVGLLATVYCFFVFFRDYLAGDPIANLPLLIIPVIFCAMCRSLPIYISESETLDLSVVSVLGVFLTQGMHAAVTIFILGTLLSFEPDPDTKKYKHSFSIGLLKVLFNNATIVLCIMVPALVLNWTPWTPGDMSLPLALLPTIVFSVLAFVFNSIFQLIRPCLNGQVSPADAAHMLLGLTPNVIGAMPLGYLIAIGYSSVANVWFVILMLLPLLLARFAWKLYLDSKSEQNRLILAFIHSLEAKDPYTQGHSQRVAEYSVQIAEAMHLSRREITTLRSGAILHDIGKIGIGDVILNKPGALTDEERAVIQSHPTIGVSVLSDVGLSAEVLELVRSHHERYDGKGYPDGIPGSQLSLTTRILCVADAYDAMTSDRPYRKGFSQEKAFAILRENAGTQFDPEVVAAFTGTASSSEGSAAA